jgi:hypothetical protein
MRSLMAGVVGVGVMAAGPAHAQFFPCEFTYAAPNDLNGGASVIVDINGDGVRDIVTHRPQGMVSLLGSAYGSFTPVFSAGQHTATFPGGIAVGDFNNDGKLDTVRNSYENDNPSIARVVIAFGTGTGSFTGEFQLLTGNWATEVDAGDIDGDGDLDIICGTELNGVQVWKNNGNGTFGPRASYAAGSINRQMELRDISGDGRPDIILINETTNQLSVLINSGSGTFPSRATYATGSYPTGLAIADFDNDGDLDVAIGHRNTLEVRLLRNAGNGTLTGWQTISNPIGSSIAVLLARDFDGDGDSDLAVVGGYGGTGWRFYTNSSGSFTAGPLQSSSAHGGWATTGLLDTDSKPDFLRFETLVGSAAITYRASTTACPGLFDVPDVFPTIQAAVNATPMGSPRTITVAPGTYNQSFALNGKNIVVRGAPNNATILDGTGLATSVVRLTGGEPATAGVENLVIRNGTVGSLIVPSATFRVGGGLYAANSSAFVKDCRFESNRADFGGGAYLFRSSTSVQGCVFLSNTAFSEGGALQLYESSGPIVGSSFTANAAGPAGAGAASALKVVGAQTAGATVLVSDCTIQDGVGGTDTSAVEMFENAGSGATPGVLRISNTVIEGNAASTGAGGLRVIGSQDSCVLADGTSICSNTPRNVLGPFLIEGKATVCDCLADLTLDGAVNGADLGVALAAWGAAASNGAGDANHDGIVDGADLASVLASWGACP